MDQPAFLVGLCLLLAHEMDGVRLGEWRIIPGLSALPEDVAARGYIAVHVPICLVMLWAVFFTVPGAVNGAVAAGLNLFFIGHLVFHLVMLRHPRNPFRGAFSWVLIAGAGLSGAIDLMMVPP